MEKKEKINEDKYGVAKVVYTDNLKVGETFEAELSYRNKYWRIAEAHLWLKHNSEIIENGVIATVRPRYLGEVTKTTKISKMMESRFKGKHLVLEVETFNAFGPILYFIKGPNTSFDVAIITVTD